MKKKVVVKIFTLILFILVLNFVSSIEIKLSKEEYYPEETLQAEITGNFLMFNQDNIAIYEEGSPRPLPIISGLTKQNDIYYFYAILPNKRGNFSFVIENAEYISFGEIKKDRIIRNFSIKEPNQTYISFNPGFVLTYGDFSIKVKSPYKNQKILVALEATNQSKSLNLIESEEKVIDYSIEKLNLNRTNIRIGNYIIPVFILNRSNVEENEIIFYPKEISGTLAIGESYFFQISIENFGDRDIENIKVSNNFDAIISPKDIGLKKGEKKILNISVPATSKETLVFGEINISYNEKSKKIKVFLNVTQNKTNVNLNGTTITENLSCKSKGGKICVYPERCSKETTESLDGPCCLGDCYTQSPSKNYDWIVGVIILIILGIIAFFFIKKARKNRKTPEEILEEKTKKFDERMNPKEVKGKLERV